MKKYEINMKIMRFGHIHIMFIFISYYFHIFWQIYFIVFSYFWEFLIEAFCVAHASYKTYSAGIEGGGALCSSSGVP